MERLPQEYGKRIVSFELSDWTPVIDRWLKFLQEHAELLEIEDIVDDLLFRWEEDEFTYEELMDFIDELKELLNEIAPEGYQFGLHPNRPYWGFFEEVD